MGSLVRDRLYYFGGSNDAFKMGNRTLVGVHQSAGVAFWRDGTWQHRLEVLPRGSPGSWDEIFVASPQVIKHGPDEWRMYYHGAGRSDRRFRIGLATSVDGLTWERQGVIIPPGEGKAWDAGGCSRRHVFRTPQSYVMIYEATSESGIHGFGLATSVDGLQWQKDSKAGRIFQPADLDSWDSRAVSAPHFVPSTSGKGGLLFYVGSSADGATGVGIAEVRDEGFQNIRRLQSL
eukprot:TRINITY_DN28837_c0_g2_i1.p1 TRINITY_DN28837_c0_g2~~TRINITY_DN28837_c0_g2_i1.p1  ORF type:complete len:263 (+),score=30.99 TRINITY_DN28837_c0_g2_i1:93-791(+)